MLQPVQVSDVGAHQRELRAGLVTPTRDPQPVLVLPAQPIQPHLARLHVLQQAIGGCQRLQCRMDPLLRASDAGRAIFLTSSVAKSHRAFWGAYAASKAGLEAIVDCYADEMENTKVRAFCIDPGAMRTKMRAGAFPGEDPETVQDPAEIDPAWFAGVERVGITAGASTPKWIIDEVVELVEGINKSD